MREFLRRDKWLRRSLVLLLLAAVGWFVVAQTTFVFAWSLDSSPADLNQIYAWCGANDPQIWGPASVSACASATHAWDLVGVIELVGLAALIVTGYRVYRYNFPKTRPVRGY